MHKQATNGVFAARDQYTLVLVNRVLGNSFDKVRNGSVHAVLQTLRLGEFSNQHWPALFDRPNGRLLDRIPDIVDISIAWIVTRVVLRKTRHGWGTNVKTSSPGLELLPSVSLLDHHFGETCEFSVHAFVEAPRLDDGKPQQVHFIHNVPGCFESSTQPRCVHDIKFKPMLFEIAARDFGFFDSLIGQRSIFPSRKQTKFVVLCLAVADNDNHGVLPLLSDGRIWNGSHAGLCEKRGSTFLLFVIVVIIILEQSIVVSVRVRCKCRRFRDSCFGLLLRDEYSVSIVSVVFFFGIQINEFVRPFTKFSDCIELVQASFESGHGPRMPRHCTFIARNLIFPIIFHLQCFLEKPGFLQELSRHVELANGIFLASGDRSEIAIHQLFKLIDNGDSGGNRHVPNFVLVDIVNGLYQPAKGVGVCDD
mmetsp:Transcript_204/g.440  ORF Transcript_204/g.440 Transcript_204/m.440 type:complete len:421 (+) Transcript_204:1363-2625(+)